MIHIFFKEEERMNIKKLTRTILVLSVITLFAAVACAQRPAQGMKTATPGKEGPKITVKGKITYTISGYFLNGEEPPGRFIIANENPQVLGKLAKKGDLVTVEGL